MENGNDHILSYKALMIVFVILLFLTVVTVGFSYVDLGKLNVYVALLIASCKASFVLLFFMHMKYESKVIKYSFLSTIIFLAIMISFTFWDVAYR